MKPINRHNAHAHTHIYMDMYKNKNTYAHKQTHTHTQSLQYPMKICWSLTFKSFILKRFYIFFLVNIFFWIKKLLTKFLHKFLSSSQLRNILGLGPLKSRSICYINVVKKLSRIYKTVWACIILIVSCHYIAIYYESESKTQLVLLEMLTNCNAESTRSLHFKFCQIIVLWKILWNTLLWSLRSRPN